MGRSILRASPGSAEAICVDPKEIGKLWPLVAHWIRRAMERGDLGTFESVEDDVRAGRALLWLVWQEPVVKAAAVTQLVRSERSKVCMIVACGGEGMTRWLPLIGRIEAYARDEGCNAVRILGRKGWMRVLKDYRAPRVVLEKRLVLTGGD